MIITGIIALILMILDQLTKYLVEIHFTTSTVKEVVPHVLKVTKLYNTGAGWGMFGDSTWMLVIVSLVASFVLGYFCYKNDWKKKKLYSIGLTLAFAGCVGNLFDRFVYCIYPEGRSGVIDMIKLVPLDNLWNLIFKHDFPTFNMADMYLVIGLIIFAIDILFFYDRRSKNENI